jgi:predicted metal-dependent peptidase
MSQIPFPLQVARARAQVIRPYFSAMIWAMKPVAAPGIKTMATDKYFRLYYDPEFINTRPVEVIVTALFHELGHNLLNHHERLKHHAEENQIMANVAGDLAINCGLLAEEEAEKRSGKSKIRTEPDWEYPKKYGFEDFKSAEEYWELLKQLKGKYGQKAGDGQMPAIGQGTCGSSATGQKAPWEQPGPGDAGFDDDQHAPGVSQVEGNSIRDETAAQIKDAASRGIGNVSAGMLRWAEDRLRSPVNYAALINFAVRAGIQDAMGWTHMKFGRLHRRQEFAGDVILPTRYRKVPRIAIGIDTSGSMSALMLSQALAEVEAAVRSVRAPVQVLTGDYGVQSAKKVFKASQVELRGGGGTDVGLTIKAVAELRPKIDLGIYVTDCYTPWPAEAPLHRVVIIRTSKGDPPPWHCRVIDVDPHEFEGQIKKKAGK